MNKKKLLEFSNSMNFPPIFFIFLSALCYFCNAEISKWQNEFGHFNRNGGTCKVNDRILAHNNPPKPLSLICNDPLYTLFKFCAKKHFYAEGGDKPKGKYSDAVLFLLNGCLHCPAGNAQATVRLLNRLPSRSIFSACDEQEIVLTSVNVHLTASGRKYSETDGTFGIGAILDGRDCGIFSTEKETEFNEIILEVEHNCGRKRPMILRVKMPPVIVELIRDRGNYREWDGISLDLSIQGFGWDEQWIEFEKVRPSDVRRHQAQKKPIIVKEAPPKKDFDEIVDATEQQLVDKKEQQNDGIPKVKSNSPSKITEFVDNEKENNNDQQTPMKEEGEKMMVEEESLALSIKLLFLVIGLIVAIIICICFCQLCQCLCNHRKVADFKGQNA